MIRTMLVLAAILAGSCEPVEPDAASDTGGVDEASSESTCLDAVAAFDEAVKSILATHSSCAVDSDCVDVFIQHKCNEGVAAGSVISACTLNPISVGAQATVSAMITDAGNSEFCDRLSAICANAGDCGHGDPECVQGQCAWGPFRY